MRPIARRSRAAISLGGWASGLALLAAACGGGSSPTPDAAADASCVTFPALLAPAGSPPFCIGKTPVAGMADLSGTWIARVVGAEVVTAPIVGVIHNQTWLYLLVTIRQQGTALFADGRYCDRVQVNQPCALTPVVLPPAWAHTETPVHRTGSFLIGADGIPVLTLDPKVEIFGATLASDDGPLPTSVTDPSVVDVDNDGNPGLTVALTGQALAGSLYSVQRQTTSVTAVPVAADRLEGALSFATDQHVLGSNPPSLATLYSQGSSGADPTPCASSFAMVKIADATASVDGGVADGGGAEGGTAGAGAVSCDWVRANETALFP